MPLLDHFSSELSRRRHCRSLFHAWTTMIAANLIHRLPPDYFAEPCAFFDIKIDPAAHEDDGPSNPPTEWTPPPPATRLPITLVTDVTQVKVYRHRAGKELLGAIE